MNLKIVGAGSAGPVCGQVRTLEACTKDESHHKLLLPFHCGDRECPICYPWVVSREAHRSEDHLRKIHDEYLKAGVDLGLPVHLILSPPQKSNYDTPADLNILYSQAYLYSSQIGLVGGCIVFHEKRGSTKEFRLLHKGIIEPDDLKTGIHFHLVGFMPSGYLEKSNYFYGRTGWIYKTIPLRETKFKTVYNIVKYELSHASYFDGKHALRWFGCCAYNNVRVDIKVRREEISCKTCKAPIGIFDIDTHELLNYATRKHETRRYWIPLNVVNRLVQRYSLARCTPRGESLLAYAIEA